MVAETERWAAHAVPLTTAHLEEEWLSGGRRGTACTEHVQSMSQEPVCLPGHSWSWCFRCSLSRATMVNYSDVFSNHLEGQGGDGE